MLAEIFLTRLQNLLRAPGARTLTPARDPRFVPIKLPRK
jgi:hypothetical protein